MHATRQELESRLAVVLAKKDAEYSERDRHAADGNELLARHHDANATDLDLAAVRLRNRLDEMATPRLTRGGATVATAALLLLGSANVRLVEADCPNGI